MRSLAVLLIFLAATPAFAWTKSTIGSGGDYATVTAWLAAVGGGAAGDKEAELISDIVDAFTISSITAGTNLWIHSAAGHRYTITASGGQMMYINQSTNALSVLVEDIEFDADGQGGDSAWYVRRLTGPFTARRCIVHNGTGYGCDIENAALANTPNVTFENVLFYDFSLEGIYCGGPSIAQTVEVVNCGVYDCLKGIFITSDADLTVNIRNSWAMNNPSGDTNHNGSSATSSLLNSVLSDSSTGDFDTVTSCATGKTSYASYFVSPGSDFHLLADDNTLWGVNGNAGTTPTLDLDRVTRSGKDIGPYDYISGGTAVPVIVNNYYKSN